MELFPFQAEDVDKLKSKRSRLVGNDPGTGKTFEGIALDLANRSGDGNGSVHVSDFMTKNPVLKTLVVCPKSAMDVWDQHLMDHTIEDIYLYTYNTRLKFMKSVLDKKKGGYFIMNYDSVRIKDMQDLQKVLFFQIIGDEIHRIKNRKAQMTVAFKRLAGLYKTGMSGTPADNKPQDLWSILNWLWPKYYTSYGRFVKAYCKEVPVLDEWGNETGYTKTVGVTDAVKQLHAEMEPWFVRRRKEDVLTDLPNKYFSRIWVELHPEQRKVYDMMKKTMVAWCEDHREELERNDPIIAQAVVVQLVRLQQMTAGYLVAKIDPKTGEQEIKYRKKWLDKEHTDFELVEVPQWVMTDPSAKIDAIMELLEDRGNEQLIIFSQSKAAINLLGERLARKRISYGLYTGDTKQADRDELVRSFQRGDVRVFAGTIKAGGESITLTASSTVVFIDRWWSPSKNLQAEDRAHRIGQTEAVEVIDIMARNTVDLGRWQAISNKWKWLQILMGDYVDFDDAVKHIDLDSVIELEQGE